LSSQAGLAEPIGFGPVERAVERRARSTTPDGPLAGSFRECTAAC